MPDKFARRFDELLQQGKDIEATKQQHRGVIEGTYVDNQKLVNWRVKVRHLISSVCGAESQHLKSLSQAEKVSVTGTNYGIFLNMKAVLEAAKEDFEGGYLNSVRQLVQAEVFDDELDQADELLRNGYKAPSAVVAGVVLETGLRALCADNAIAISKLDRMNADLTKAGIYSNLVQKQITALAAVRNAAAHGEEDKYSKDDVANMIRDVRRILGERLT